jgi:hypothetical protein
MGPPGSTKAKRDSLTQSKEISSGNTPPPGKSSKQTSVEDLDWVIA